MHMTSTEIDPGRRVQIGVIGRGRTTADDVTCLAHAVGREIARAGHILICGGQGGIMEAAAKGAKECGGLTVGILMSYDKNSANPFIDIRIPTGLNHARNTLVVSSSDAIIAIDGGLGTLCELALAAKLKIPAVGVQTWIASSPHHGNLEIVRAQSAEEAVRTAIALATEGEQDERCT